MGTTGGWSGEPRPRARAVKRGRTATSAATALGSCLIATRRWSWRWRPATTTPKPPCPITSPMSYAGSASAMSCCSIAISQVGVGTRGPSRRPGPVRARPAEVPRRLLTVALWSRAPTSSRSASASLLPALRFSIAFVRGVGCRLTPGEFGPTTVPGGPGRPGRWVVACASPIRVREGGVWPGPTGRRGAQMGDGTARIGVEAGAGLVGRFGEAVVLVAPETAADDVPTAELLDLVEAAASEAGRPGAAIAARLAGWVSGRTPSDRAAFGLVAPVADT